MKKIFSGIFLFLAISLSLLPQVLLAQTTQTTSGDPYGFGGKLNQVAGNYAAGCDDACLENRVGTIIQVFLSFLGVIFLILMLYAGFRWMTAAGDEEQIKKSTATIRAAVIGLVIVIAAYALSVFVIERIWGTV